MYGAEIWMCLWWGTSPSSSSLDFYSQRGFRYAKLSCFRDMSWLSTYLPLLEKWVGFRNRAHMPRWWRFERKRVNICLQKDTLASLLSSMIGGSKLIVIDLHPTQCQHDVRLESSIIVLAQKPEPSSPQNPSKKMLHENDFRKIRFQKNPPKSHPNPPLKIFHPSPHPPQLIIRTQPYLWLSHLMVSSAAAKTSAQPMVCLYPHTPHQHHKTPTITPLQHYYIPHTLTTLDYDQMTIYLCHFNDIW